MSYSTRRFKMRTSKTLVRSSHSSVRPEVNVSKCPQMCEGSVALDEVESSNPRTGDVKQRKAVGGKKAAKKPMSPPKSRSKSSSRSLFSAAQRNPIQQIQTDDFLEEMKAGLDEMGEKLKNVEKELTRQKIIGGPPSKPEAFNRKTFGKKNEGSTVYNPIDFTEMDFAGALEVDTFAFDEDISGESKPFLSEPENRPVPKNEAVESVIAKIRSDIKNWRISRGIEVNSNGDMQEPSVISNRRGEIVVQEDAERETPYESNRMEGWSKNKIDEDFGQLHVESQFRLRDSLLNYGRKSAEQAGKIPSESQLGRQLGQLGWGCWVCWRLGLSCCPRRRKCRIT